MVQRQKIKCFINQDNTREDVFIHHEEIITCQAVGEIEIAELDIVVGERSRERILSRVLMANLFKEAHTPQTIDASKMVGSGGVATKDLVQVW